MADVVPLNRRVDIRQEILPIEADDEVLKVRECQEIKVKVHRSLKEAEAQSFQLYHPQVDQAIRKKEELHKALREHREPTLEESFGHKELVTEEMLDNEMAILAPLQKGMQRLRRRTSAPRTPTRNHTLKPLEVSAWPDDLRQALERGLFCPLDLDDPEDIPNVASRRSMSPTSGDSASRRTHGTRRRCWRRCPIWRHRPPPKVPLLREKPANVTAWTRRRASCPCSSGR